MPVLENDVIEVTARMEIGGSEDVINVYQFRVFDVVDSSELAIVDDLIDIMEDVYTYMVGFQSTSLQYKDLTFRNVSQGLVYGTYGWDSLTAGTSSSDVLAYGVSALINFGTQVARVMLRKYFGGFTEPAAGSDSTWITTLMTALANVAAYLLADRIETAAKYQFGYLSIPGGGFVLPVSGVANDVPAYQRRRKPGRGS